MDEVINESIITQIDPLNINLSELMKDTSYEGKFIIFRYVDEVKDDITLLAYSSDARKLRKYMDSLNDSSLFITNIPKQSGVYYLGGI